MQLFMDGMTYYDRGRVSDVDSPKDAPTPPAPAPDNNGGKDTANMSNKENAGISFHDPSFNSNSKPLWWFAEKYGASYSVDNYGNETINFGSRGLKVYRKNDLDNQYMDPHTGMMYKNEDTFLREWGIVDSVNIDHDGLGKIVFTLFNTERDPSSYADKFAERVSINGKQICWDPAANLSSYNKKSLTPSSGGGKGNIIVNPVTAREIFYFSPDLRYALSIAGTEGGRIAVEWGGALPPLYGAPIQTAGEAAMLLGSIIPGGYYLSTYDYRIEIEGDWGGIRHHYYVSSAGNTITKWGN